MAKWRLLCRTCKVQVAMAARVTTQEQAQWELKYHISCYHGHDAYVTAQPNPKKRKEHEEQERETDPGDS